MSRSTQFIVSLVGTAVCAAVLLLLLPSHFRDGGQGNVAVLVVFGALTVAFAAATHRLRPRGHQAQQR